MSTKNQLVSFGFNGHDVRVVTVDGDPWWVAKDVCNVLGVDTSNLSKMLDDDEKGTYTIRTPGGPQEMAVINEPGLYSLILRSRKPEAKEFKRWVTHEVLPQLRKTGSYSTRPAATKAEHATHKMLQQLRLAVGSGLLSNQEAREFMGLAEIPCNEKLTTKMAKQVYAVAAKAAEKINQQMVDKSKQQDLWQ